MKLDFSLFFPPGVRASEPLCGSGFFLYGPRGVGKSSFAYQAAVNTVLAGGTVVVMCHEHNVSRRVPMPFTPISSLSRDELRRLEFMYVNDWAAALTELWNMESSRSVPDVILIDDEGFGLVVDGARNPMMAAANCLSYCLNMRERLGGSSSPGDLGSNGKKALTFIVISNAIGGDGLELPLTALPMVQVRFTVSGFVHVLPLPCDMEATVEPFSLGWNELSGLCLV